RADRGPQQARCASPIPVEAELHGLHDGLGPVVDPELLVEPVAVGADGFMVDVHHAPDTALVDGAQALLPAEFAALMDDVRRLTAALNLEI
ncbi:MAG: hypothetical protein RI637_13925, partial [Acidimicrobiia bacterium]|nr:hypothetical protein [Acidimicrobiia bacterium]